MDHLVRLDVPRAMPLFRDYLVAMSGVVAHPDQRYIDCEEAYKQCLWLENRGYKAIQQPAARPASAQSRTSLVSFVQQAPR